MAAYYNEIDPFAAAWLRELIKAGHIAPGEVDERSIADVMPSDLAGFTQCHFFAGIGVWSYALRQAGWPDDRSVWTGSCPCQPFSSAGKREGFADERHLWPEFYRLISQCRPATCFGEQVASKDGLAWVELVQDNMEGAGYAFGAVDTCAAGFGAPHIRQRLYWVADAIGSGQQGQSWCSSAQEQRVAECGVPDGLDNTKRNGRRTRRDNDRGNDGQQFNTAGNVSRPGPTNGFWGDADWLLCRDGKWRATQSLVIEMADGLAHRLGYSRFGAVFSLNPLKETEKEDMRIGRLRGYGNAIVAPQAAAFIESFMEIIKEPQPCPN